MSFPGIELFPVVCLRGLRFIVVLSVLVLAASYALPEPGGLTLLKSRAQRIGCAEPACMIALGEMGKDYPEFTGKAEALAREKGDAWGALALGEAKGDLSGLEGFSGAIGAIASQGIVPARGLDENYLAAYALHMRSASDPANPAAAARAAEAKEWAESHASASFVYFYLAQKADWSPPALPAGAGDAERLLASYGGFKSAWEFVSFPTAEQEALARSLEADLGGASRERLAEGVYALWYYYSARYPGVGLRSWGLELATVYVLPAAFVCAVPLLILFSAKGRDGRSRYQREMAENVLLCAALVPVTLLFGINVLCAVPALPAAGAAAIFAPLFAPLFLYVVASMRTQRDYGMIREMSVDALLEKARRFFWVTVGGAFLSLLLFTAILNLQRLTAPLKGPLGEIAIPAIAIAAMLAIAPFVPGFIEVVSRSREVEDRETRARMSALCSRVGCSAESVRVLPSTGSTYTNAMQVGIFSGSVRIFLFANLLDKAKFAPREMEAVVAHELGHVMKNHLLKSTVFYVSCYLLLLTVFSTPLFFFAKGTNAAADLVVSAGPYAGLGITLLATFWLRRQLEFEADAFAGGLGYGDALLSALKKISRANLAFSRRPKALRFLDTHGGLNERMRRLRAVPGRAAGP
ncbi:MAG: M48 family metalloprotease [Candidatus ainarchaeum sp.]|nr:M48 family metalloprotease [Candidatus ainarchaeum sp.]